MPRTTVKCPGCGERGHELDGFLGLPVIRCPHREDGALYILTRGMQDEALASTASAS